MTKEYSHHPPLQLLQANGPTPYWFLLCIVLKWKSANSNASLSSNGWNGFRGVALSGFLEGGLVNGGKKWPSSSQGKARDTWAYAWRRFKLPVSVGCETFSKNVAGSGSVLLRPGEILWCMALRCWARPREDLRFLLQPGNKQGYIGRKRKRQVSRSWQVLSHLETALELMLATSETNRVSLVYQWKWVISPASLCLELVQVVYAVYSILHGCSEVCSLQKKELNQLESTFCEFCGYKWVMIISSII